MEQTKPKRNESPAVWAQRYSGGKSSALDDFPTPPWATRALLEYVLPQTGIKQLQTPVERSRIAVWEPAANRGYMVNPLREYFINVVASDIVAYEDGIALDFLYDFTAPNPPEFNSLEKEKNILSFQAIITNPPFIKAPAFIKKSFHYKDLLFTAFFVRTSFLEGKKRYFDIFKDFPPDIVAPFVERVSLVPGKLDKDATLATSYCWFVWVLDKKSKR